MVLAARGRGRAAAAAAAALVGQDDVGSKNARAPPIDAATATVAIRRPALRPRQLLAPAGRLRAAAMAVGPVRIHVCERKCKSVSSSSRRCTSQSVKGDASSGPIAFSSLSIERPDFQSTSTAGWPRAFSLGARGGSQEWSRSSSHTLSSASPQRRRRPLEGCVQWSGACFPVAAFRAIQCMVDPADLSIDLGQGITSSIVSIEIDIEAKHDRFDGDFQPAP